MNSETRIHYLKQKVPGWFFYSPNKCILERRIKELLYPSFSYDYHYFIGNSKVEEQLLFNVNDEDIYKITYQCDALELKEGPEETLKKKIENFLHRILC